MSEEYQSRLFAVEKRCNKCGETKPLNEFYEWRPNRWRNDCKECGRARHRAWSKLNPQRSQGALRGKFCQVEGCVKKERARGWCTMHYARWQRHGDPLYERSREPSPCDVEGCQRSASKRGWCEMHYMRWCKHGDPGAAEMLRNPPQDPNATHKACIHCGGVKPVVEFDGSRNCCKACRRARARKWSEENPERRREQRRRYYERHKDRVNEQARQWVEANPKKRREVARRHNHKRFAENPQYWADRFYQYGQVRRARLMDAPGEGATLAELIAVHGELCYICQTAKANTVDHVFPLSKGGTNYFSNLMPACRPCNSRKSNKI